MSRGRMLAGCLGLVATSLAFPAAPALDATPQAVDTTLSVTPRVGASGAAVVAAGHCSGTARLTVIHRAAGWYDVPAVVVDATPIPDSDGNWTLPFPMPVVPSHVRVQCTWSGGFELVVVPIAPSAGDLPSAFPIPDGSGHLVDLRNAEQPGLAEAFTVNGGQVELTVVSSWSTPRVRIEPPPGPLRVVIIGSESLGENAEARQVTRVQAWTVDTPAPPATTTSTTLPPATSTTLDEVTDPPPPPRLPTVVTLTSSRNPAVLGTPIAFTATVGFESAGAPPPSGDVQFFVDGIAHRSPAKVSGGVAVSGSLTGLAVGSHSIIAVYSGDIVHRESSTTPLDQIVVAPTFVPVHPVRWVDSCPRNRTARFRW